MSDGESLRFQPLGSGLRWLALAFIAIGSIGFVCAIVGGVVLAIAPHGSAPVDDDVAILCIIAFSVLMLGLYGQMFVAPFWIYRAWSWLPPDERYTKHWKSWISPEQAAWFLVIPYFQYYWMFVINCGLCDALDRLRGRYATNDVAPKSIAITASVCQLLIPFPVGMILWILFMAKVERMTREMASS